MNAVTQDLFHLLRQVAQGKLEQDQCAVALKLWRTRHELVGEQTASVLTQFAAQLLHAVRTNQLPADIASELLSNLIVFGDLDVPPALYALQATLKLMADQKAANDQSGPSPEQFVKEQMGRMLAAMPERSQHKAEQCRYSGRFGSLRRSA
jgi:hypothetical protein